MGRSRNSGNDNVSDLSDGELWSRIRNIRAQLVERRIVFVSVVGVVVIIDVVVVFVVVTGGIDGRSRREVFTITVTNVVRRAGCGGLVLNHGELGQRG